MPGECSMAGTLDLQIRPPSPSYSDAISLISPLQEEIDVVTELDMSVRTASSFNDEALVRVNQHEEYYIPSGDTVFMVCCYLGKEILLRLILY